MATRHIVLPALAASAVLALGGCGGAEERPSSTSDASEKQQKDQAEQNSDDSAVQGDEGDSSDDRADDGQDARPDDGQDAEPAGDDGPSNGDLYGYWATQSSGDQASLLLVAGDRALFVESLRPEGDTCTGTLSDGALSMECEQSGNTAWPDTEATIEVTHSPKNIDVSWSSGTTQSYYRAGEHPEDVPDHPREQVEKIDPWLDEIGTT